MSLLAVAVLIASCSLMTAQSWLELSATRRLEAPRRWNARLFEISEGLEHPTPCYVASQTGSCYRVRAGEIAYDPQLGYPHTVAYRRQIYPNLVHADYWRRVLQTRQLPDCGPISPVVRIRVMSLRPRI